MQKITKHFLIIIMVVVVVIVIIITIVIHYYFHFLYFPNDFIVIPIKFVAYFIQFTHRHSIHLSFYKLLPNFRSLDYI